jgi:hypothetical protein
VIDQGKSVCHDLRFGAPVSSALAEVARAGYAPTEAFIIVASTTYMCPDVLPVFKDWHGRTATTSSNRPVHDHNLHTACGRWRRASILASTSARSSSSCHCVAVAVRGGTTFEKPAHYEKWEACPVAGLAHRDCLQAAAEKDRPNAFCMTVAMLPGS